MGISPLNLPIILSHLLHQKTQIAYRYGKHLVTKENKSSYGNATLKKSQPPRDFIKLRLSLFLYAHYATLKLKQSNMPSMIVQWLLLSGQPTKLLQISSP